MFYVHSWDEWCHVSPCLLCLCEQGVCAGVFRGYKAVTLPVYGCHCFLIFRKKNSLLWRQLQHLQPQICPRQLIFMWLSWLFELYDCVTLKSRRAASCKIKLAHGSIIPRSWAFEVAHHTLKAFFGGACGVTQGDPQRASQSELGVLTLWHNT